MDTIKPDKHSNKPYRTRFYQKTSFVFFLINAACFVQYVNMQYLASSMRGLEMDLNFSPENLTLLITGEAVGLLITIPVWGVLSDLFEIKYVLMLSILGSAFLLLLFGWLSDLFSMFIVRVLNGAMMGSIIPATQKYVIVANMKNTGLAFGIFHATSNLGRLVASILITTFSTGTYFKLPGWRICSFVLGFFCGFCGVFLFLIPRLKPKNYRKSFYDLINLDEERTLSNAFKVIWKRFLNFMSGKTVKLLTLMTFLGQGIFTAGYFITMYFQYCRLSNLRSGVTTGMIVIGGVTGGVIGGLTVDKLHNRFPKYGRLCVGIATGFLRLAALIYGFFYITFDNMMDQYYLLAFCIFTIGLSIASVSFVDRAIAMEILLPSEQSFGIGTMLFISGTTSALIFTPSLSFFLKIVFGYKEIDMDIQDLPVSFLRKNAFALRNGIALLCIFSTVCYIVMYMLMLPTYYKDAQAIKDKVSKKGKTSKLKVVIDKSVEYPNSRQETVDIII